MARILTASPSDPATNAVVSPSPGDPRSAASISTPLQALLDGLMFIRNLLFAGGTLTPTSPIVFGGTGIEVAGSGLLVTGPMYCTNSVNLNGSSTNVNGNLNVTGVARYTRRTSIGATSGTTTYGFANWDRVYLLASQTASVGTVWKIDTTGARLGEEILFEHLGSGSIQIQDPSGATIGGLSHASGGTYSQTFVLYASGVLACVAEKYKP